MAGIYDPSYIVVDYRPEWPRLYEAEKGRLLAALGAQVERIEHVGSTSVPGLAAKPIVDIEIEVTAIDPMEPYRTPLEALGYRFTFDPETPDLHFFGYPAERPRRHHLHLSQTGAGHMDRVVAVRDYLRTHPGEAADYARIKRALTDARPGDRDAYVAGKDAFVKGLEHRALAWYRGRAEHARQS